MTTTPMSAERREELRVSAGFGTRGGINASEIGWLLQQARRAEVLRAEVDAWRAGHMAADLIGTLHGDYDKPGETLPEHIGMAYAINQARAATDALEKETGHAG